MAKALTQTIQTQISTKDISVSHILTIDGTTYSSDLLETWSVSYDKSFGSASATFTLDNNDGKFGSGGSDEIEVGDIVSFTKSYIGDTTTWKNFYGQVTQRAIEKSAGDRSITITCLDYISILKNWDIDLEVEGDKVLVENEVLTPNYLPAPNDNLAQLFDFANDSIATDPLPIVMIQDIGHLTQDPQYDGYQILYSVGQIRLGAPLSARYDYNVLMRQYYYYRKGVYAEDVLEQIFTQADGYGGYLFGETSAQDVIDNHLTTTYEAEEGTGTTDTMTPNLSSTTITIETQVATNDITAGDVSIIVDSTDGFPTTGTATINGDTFTWTGKTSTAFTGIPATGSNALLDHSIDDYVEYENSYSAGQVWYLDYTNLVTTMTSSDFTIPSGSIEYVDKRFGRIILDGAISLSATVTCDTNYSFKTLQATAIELNYMSFRSREMSNRYDAIEKLKKYLAPNYIIRTKGDDKIWASYVRQKTTADYTLDLVEKLNYLEDEDLYTRVKFFAKNSEPTNLMYNEGVDFSSSGATYKSLATMTELYEDGEEGNSVIYKCLISNAGYIDLEVIKPLVYINDIPIDDKAHQVGPLQVIVNVDTQIETKTGCHGISSESYSKSHTYYYYSIRFAHTNIEPSKSIILYKANGETALTITAYNGNMDYARGVYNVPHGDEANRNSTIELCSTALYWVFYATDALTIDYDNVIFKINKTLLPVNTSQVIVKATFEYWSVMIPVKDIASIIDGRYNTQVQVEFFAEPPAGYNLSIIDLGGTYTVQALDIIAGFFKPDQYRKFDIDFNFTLQYSTDNVNYYEIGDKTHNVKLTGGQSVQFEEEDLGTSFTVRYLKFILEYVKKIPYGDKDFWVIALTEVAAYDDIIINSNATLISTAELTQAVNPSDTTVYVTDTTGFTEPGSGETATIYIDKDENVYFTYSGLTSTTFTDCVVGSGMTGIIGDKVTQSIAGDTTLYDDDELKQKMGDRLFKQVKIDDQVLYTQAQLDTLAKAYLEEFYKDHSKVSVDVMCSPFLQVGQTISLTDAYNNISGVKYFIESVSDNGGSYNLVLGKYP